MPIFIADQTRCPICNNLVQPGSQSVTFPLFEGNTMSPLYRFSGSIVHKSCYENSPFKAQLDNRLRELKRLEAQPRVDFITGTPLTLPFIGHPDNVIGTGFLTDDPDDPLYRFNNLLINRKNLSQWAERNALIRLLSEYDATGEWGGNALKNLISILQSPPKPDYDPAFLARFKENHPEQYDKLMAS